MEKSNIAVIIGQRLRARRNELGYSQYQTSEKADVHPTYIGQLERGEKNATLESVEKISRALDIPMNELFANIGGTTAENKAAQNCYDMIVTLPIKEQEAIQLIIQEIIKYKKQM